MLTPDEIKIFSLCVPHLPASPIVFDVGAYKGGYSEMVLTYFRAAKLFLFEPNDALCNDLKVKYGNKSAFNVLLSHWHGKQSFYRCLDKADELSSSYNREIFSEVKNVEENKPCTYVDFFCLEHEILLIDFLKIDVEGSELDVLKGAEEMLKNKCIRFIQVEYGGTYLDAGITFEQVIQFVEQFGYKVYELINDKLHIVQNFVEDYRFTNFLITRHDFR
jgi:FkbM family methyltransferase